MNEIEYDKYFKTIEDHGLITVLHAMIYGELALEVVSFNKELEKKGFVLTTYYCSNFYRTWAIYDKNAGRPARSIKCCIDGRMSFNAQGRLTKRSNAFNALEAIKKDFKKYEKNPDIFIDRYKTSKNIVKKYHKNIEINKLLNELSVLFNSNNQLDIEKAIRKIKAVRNPEIEEIIIKKITYNNPTSEIAGLLYIKKGSIFNLPLFHSEINNAKHWYSIISIIGYSSCKSAKALKNKIHSLTFPTSENNLFQRTQKLKKLPSEIGNFNKLKILNLSGNKLQKLPLEIGQLKLLEMLDLSINYISELPVSIAKLKNLKLLNLSGNPIKYIPKEILDLGILKNINYY